MTTFPKIFKNGGHFEFFEFSPKMRKHKNASISSTVGDRAISSKFLTPRISKDYTVPTFEEMFKNGGHFEFFKFFEKVRKHKIASISLTIGDRAISSKFSTPRVSKKYTKPTLKKISKMVAILNFQIFAKNAKTQNICYLLNHDR